MPRIIKESHFAISVEALPDVLSKLSLSGHVIFLEYREVWVSILVICKKVLYRF